jgi:hypothetical protein
MTYADARSACSLTDTDLGANTLFRSRHLLPPNPSGDLGRQRKRVEGQIATLVWRGLGRPRALTGSGTGGGCRWAQHHRQRPATPTLATPPIRPDSPTADSRRSRASLLPMGFNSQERHGSHLSPAGLVVCAETRARLLGWPRRRCTRSTVSGYQRRRWLAVSDRGSTARVKRPCGARMDVADHPNAGQAAAAQ